MPSEFELEFSGSLFELKATFGLVATYTSPTGVVTPNITVRVHRNEPHQVDRAVRTSGELQTGEIVIDATEVPKPIKGGRITVESVEVWTIENTPVQKNGQFYCTVVRDGSERLMPRRTKDA